MLRRRKRQDTALLPGGDCRRRGRAVSTTRWWWTGRSLGGRWKYMRRPPCCGGVTGCCTSGSTPSGSAGWATDSRQPVDEFLFRRTGAGEYGLVCRRGSRDPVQRRWLRRGRGSRGAGPFLHLDRLPSPIPGRLDDDFVTRLWNEGYHFERMFATYQEPARRQIRPRAWLFQDDLRLPSWSYHSRCPLGCQAGACPWHPRQYDIM